MPRVLVSIFTSKNFSLFHQNFKSNYYSSLYLNIFTARTAIEFKNYELQKDKRLYYILISTKTFSKSYKYVLNAIKTSYIKKKRNVYDR